MDTTSLYFEGAGGQTLGRRGFSKDHRPDLNQMILAVLLDGDGRPVCTEMWPGNTADVKSLIPAIDRLQRRFRINRVCVVADRGMISAETIAELEARKLLYVLGVRERTDKLVRDLVLGDPAPFVPFVLMKPRREVDYEAKAVTLAGRRYVVCRNLDEMKKDAANRATIVAALERQLKKGDKSLVGNKGYRRFLKNPEGDGFAIDRERIEEDAKFDGVFVLQTNAHLSPLEAMLVYKQLWTVERTFRTTKSLLDTRPIYHKLDETIRGHVACSFLALVLKKELEDRLAAADKGARASWPAVIADLDSLTETEVEQDGKRFLLRSAPRPGASLALSALGVALPPTMRQIAERLIYANLLLCSATPAPQRDFARAIKNLAPGTVEDQFDAALGTRRTRAMRGPRDRRRKPGAPRVPMRRVMGALRRRSVRRLPHRVTRLRSALPPVAMRSMMRASGCGRSRRGCQADDGRWLRTGLAAPVALRQVDPRQALDRPQKVALGMVAERDRDARRRRGRCGRCGGHRPPAHWAARS